ncbi:hypothetical protein [Aliikangiella sp. G2MR2-5]|uniref:hypothetical protein n=1 Tax=Aliikangiella sp. G2MR2-5 TaxID=2788943 RepID=UPI0018AAFEE3|nr:hypothetical protein [Aliikangiella sp. G2MR2-5]
MQQLPEIQIDMTNLVKEDVYTDQKIGSVRVLTPVNANGETDDSRNVIYFGQTQVMTQAGPLPLNFEIEVNSLKEAFEQFGDNAKAAMERTMKEIQEYQREQASKIVVPGQDTASKIQLP